ncbi:hypothetical protein O3P69_001759 [Scylla paramamosain]|uniref:Uncharacterized protein n=1 Tax=Scylla paramamosain TaxID=85552 RepID=A0AAW0V1S3_SCYPA
MRGHGESLTRLAQDLELLVCCAYPEATSRPQETRRGWRKGSDASQRAQDLRLHKLPRCQHPDHSGGRASGQEILLPDSGLGSRTYIVQEGVLATQQPLVAKQQLCGITAHCTQLKGPVEARIEVGGTEEHLPIYVAEVGENLLGLDYLQQSKSVLDGCECEVSVEIHKAPTALLPEASHRCCLSRELEGESLVNPEDVHGGVANLSSEMQMRPAGEALGVCEGVQKAGGLESHFEDTQKSSTGVPPHLQDLLQ